MAKIDVKDLTGAVKGSIELSDEIFGIEPNEVAMSTVVRNQLANKRQGTQKTKTRSEVSGGGKRPYRQKGTGRARHGSERSAQYVGGGIIFGIVVVYVNGCLGKSGLPVGNHLFDGQGFVVAGDQNSNLHQQTSGKWTESFHVTSDDSIRTGECQTEPHQ